MLNHGERTAGPDIVRRAYEVFKDDVARVPPLTLRGGNDVDSYTVAQPYDSTQDAETDTYLEQFSFWGVTYLDAESWRHYLPALMSYSLRKPDDPAMVVEALVRSLRPPDRYPPRLATLTADQEAVVTAFLEHLALSDTAPHLRDDAQQALEEWWWPHPRCRPTSEDIAAMRTAPLSWREVVRDLYRLMLPDTLVGSGARDVPTESRQVETWGGYVCGDVHTMVAVNITPVEMRSVAACARARTRLFRDDVVARPVDVRGARQARYLEGRTHGDSPAEPHALTMMIAEAGTHVVTLSIRTWPRDDVRRVVERVIESFEITTVAGSS
jgi:hypothetical protein